MTEIIFVVIQDANWCSSRWSYWV